MNNSVTTAMALALVAGVAGLSAVPFAAAVDNNCHSNFDIADSEQSAEVRSLMINGRDVGLEEVSSVSGGEELTVRLEDAGAAGKLEWRVFHKPSTSCVQYTAGDCDQDNVLDQDNEEAGCTLQPPVAGVKSYWVVYEEITGNNAIDYLTFVEPV